MSDHHLNPRAADALHAAIDALRTAAASIRSAAAAQEYETTGDERRAIGALASLATQVDRAVGAAAAVRDSYVEAER